MCERKVVLVTNVFQNFQSKLGSIHVLLYRRVQWLDQLHSAWLTLLTYYYDLSFPYPLPSVSLQGWLDSTIASPGVRCNYISSVDYIMLAMPTGDWTRHGHWKASDDSVGNCTDIQPDARALGRGLSALCKFRRNLIGIRNTGCCAYCDRKHGQPP